MRTILILVIISSLLTACSSTKKLSNETAKQETMSGVSEPDGSSYEKAVKINERRESKGVDAEYIWLNKHYPGYRLKLQSLNFQGKKPYDVLTIVTAEGIEKKIYFDISNFFGKS